MNRLTVACWAALAAPALSACSAGVAAGGAATVGVAAAEERTMGEVVDDTVISAQVNSNLLQKNVDLFSKVGVEVVQGRVLLTGVVPKPEDRIEAARLAWKVDGVKEVANEIQVADTSSLLDYARDGWISTQLRSKVLLDKDIRSINYSIETVNGVIYLIGIAQNQAELDRVTAYARTIKYVRKVVSYVRVLNRPTA